MPLNEKLDWMVNEGLLAPNDDLIERSSEEERRLRVVRMGKREKKRRKKRKMLNKMRKKSLNKRPRACWSAFIRHWLCVHQHKNACKYAFCRNLFD